MTRFFALLAFATAAHLQAATINITYTTAAGADGVLVYLSDPNGAQPAHDSFNADIISPQYGNGTLSVPNDFTNYITATGHADIANFTFATGTFSGSQDAVLNFSNGSVALTYHITSGTGAFSGATGTLTEAAHFTSFGSFAPNVPATAAITSGGGPLVVSPEPSAIALFFIGFTAVYISVHTKSLGNRRAAIIYAGFNRCARYLF